MLYDERQQSHSTQWCLHGHIVYMLIKFLFFDIDVCHVVIVSLWYGLD